MGCVLGAIIVGALTFWIGWPTGTVIGVAFYVVIQWAVWKQDQESKALQDEGNRKIIGR